MVIIGAIMRKLLHICFGDLKYKAVFNPEILKNTPSFLTQYHNHSKGELQHEITANQSQLMVIKTLIVSMQIDPL